MTLSEWFQKTGCKKGDFAAAIEVTPQIISAYCKGYIWPTKAKMRAIERHTNGEVTANDFVQLEPQPKRQYVQ